jgi:hypothetical protein
MKATSGTYVIPIPAAAASPAIQRMRIDEQSTRTINQGTSIMNSKLILFASAAAVFACGLAPASAQDVREFSFGYDQPKPTGYGFAGDLFESTIAELSGGTMKINQFPGAQLGQEPVMLQKVRSGDIDFIITASANGATLSPQLGVMSLHYLFEDEEHLAKGISSPELNARIIEPERVYTHRWRPGDLIIWDNRCMLHKAEPYDTAAEARVLRRCTVVGEVPI